MVATRSRATRALGLSPTPPRATRARKRQRMAGGPAARPPLSTSPPDDVGTTGGPAARPPLSTSPPDDVGTVGGPAARPPLSTSPPLSASLPLAETPIAHRQADRKDKMNLARKLKQQSPARSVTDCRPSDWLGGLWKNCELKQQSPARSVADSGSSNLLSEWSTAATMKDIHPWPPEEELFVLKPLATSDKERALYLECKKTYRETVANRVNTQFENKVTGYVQLNADKVLTKFRQFSRRYEDYQKAPGHIIQDPNTTKEAFELVEIYIAKVGWIFSEPSSSSRSSKRKRTDGEIQKAAELIGENCSDEELTMYLSALQYPTVLVGFQVRPDIESKKRWLDAHVKMLNDRTPGWWVKLMYGI